MKIEANKLRKSFGKEVALNDFTISISGEKIVGLLGRNGAGKTTFMRLLAGHFQQTSGRIEVNGHAPFNHYPATKEICLIEESNNFHEKFSIEEILQISAVFYPNWNKDQADHLIKVFKLKRKQKVKALSKGMVSALGIIVGLSSNAAITIFDEPYIGLDASYRSVFYDLLLEAYEDNPRMFILSTHLIDEVSNLFEEVAIIHEGNLLLHETADDLARKNLLLSGNTDLVNKTINGKKVIHESTILGQKSVVLFDESIEKVEGLKVSKASLQELVVYLTKEEVPSYDHRNKA